MVSYVAIPFQIYTLTGSNFAVGAVGLVELAPLVVFGLYGGALADHVDRKKLLVSCGFAQAAFTGVLAFNAFRDDGDGYGPRGRGFQAHVDVPAEVEAAYAALVAAHPDWGRPPR